MPTRPSPAADRLPPAGPVVADDELGHEDRIRPTELLREGVTHVVGLVRRRPLGFAVAVAGAVVFVAGVLATAELVGDLTDELLVPVLERGEAPGPRLRTFALLLLGAGIWRAVGITVRRSAAGWTHFAVLADLRSRLVEHQLDLPLSWYGRQRVGDLLAVNEGHVRQAVSVLNPLPFATGAVLLAVGSVAFTFVIDPTMGLAVAVALALIVVVELVAAWSAFRAFVVEQHRLAIVARVAHESIDGAQTVRALGARTRETERFALVVGRLRDAQLVVQRRFAWLRASMEALPSALSVPVVVVGAVRVGDGAVTAGDVVTVAYLLTLLAMPLSLLGFLVWDTAHGLTGWRRVRAVLDERDTVVFGDDGRAPAGAARVGAESVGFGYGDGGRVLEDLELELAAGGTVAVVGPTASGKSSLLLLLARLWDPDRGRVELDGRDVRGLSREALAAQVVMVGQEAFLFADTVRGNVTVGEDVADERVWEALALAGADDVVRALPDGLDTELGERGATLSGGQRQRIALARALVRRPRLLLLDDATSAVDPSVEARILERLRAAALPATVVVVATRPASIALCDRVALLDDGRIVATGTHAQLLAAEPRYAALLQAYEQDRTDREEVGR
jgi:ABC-type multidrug transport system fused ATPase/permease subunit